MCTKNFVEAKVIRDLYGVGLTEHFGHDKTMTSLKKGYY